MLVLTGVSTPQDAVLAPRGQRPTYIAADLGGLAERQPVVGPRGRGRLAPADGSAADAEGESPAGQGGAGPRAFRCGGWQATRPPRSDPIELTGDGAWIDGLRALCAAAWSAGHVSEEMAGPALKALGDPR